MDIDAAVEQHARLRGMSLKTVKTYLHCIHAFKKQCNKQLHEITKQDVIEYLDELCKKEKAGSTVNVHLQSIKFFFGVVLKKRLLLSLRGIKKPKKLPVVLSKEEVHSLINTIENPKHRLIVELLYGSGLRVGEVIRLRPRDIDLDQMRGWVRCGKGKKDRMFVIPESIKEKIHLHMKGKWLFSGNNNHHLSIMSVQLIVKEAAKKAGLYKNVHPHTLRHSFATHLIDAGYPLVVIQTMLGHANMSTTLTYIKTSSRLHCIKSPLDELNNIPTLSP
ncbi:tyrosine-type recombinase/integrase [Candidatus Woesearchaeota archaeon]|nr:tyrosine-type recombinase/integrase [Candidatus Woesearchaeota archaeon]HIH38303.1 tyrosine-type recombinase/integrase [Candidatus Woesearchaeota archaeon]HIH48441.1 tyrosine-type recombinase/integrase [Candidatus Woesearchaeota archaeon]HIJ03305.1 tyrosine-type recombinase/integrase [Candidatus Woesearchaeota archaeon]